LTCSPLRFPPRSRTDGTSDLQQGNSESLFIYVLMILLRTDEASAAVVFATLNTTRET
jgi:hypothetical protein